MLYERELFKRIVESSTVLIYGAGIMAQQVGQCLMSDPYNVRIAAFVVTKTEGNPVTLLKRPVISVHVAKQIFPKESLIVVACVEKNRLSIEETLRNTKFDNIILLTFESDAWSGIRGNYMRSKLDRSGYKYRVLAEELRNTKEELCEKTLAVYRAISDLDKELGEDISTYSWEKEIFVGAALSENCSCDIRDDVGDNISKDNRVYCELTALYWLWKNSTADYVGLCHYRRHFCLDKDARDKIVKSDIDVILTVPVINYPSVLDVYENDHVLEDWKVMKKAMIIFHPDYYFDLLKVENGNFYFGYNMFIAKKEIFDQYCKWLFSILDFCREYCAPKQDPYQNRYLGFLGERLLTVYMLHNYDEYKIAIADKHFVE